MTAIVAQSSSGRPVVGRAGWATFTLGSMDSEERLAVFLDYENLALGARDLGGLAFHFRPISDALAIRGRVVVRRAYADWSFFAEDRHELTREHIELIEMSQHQGASRKNAADIKMVVDAVEMAFERDYISTFVIYTGDSDFSPLVHKLRELNKQVIGIGVSNSTSRLLPSACDEFLFYERLEGVELSETGSPRRRRGGERSGQPAGKQRADDGAVADRPKGTDAGGRGGGADQAGSGAASQQAEPEAQQVEQEADQDGLDHLPGDRALAVLVAQTLADLSSSGAVTASVLKRTMLRKDPTFGESDYGFRTFGEALRHLEGRGLVEISPGPAAGDPEVTLPERGERDVAFAVVAELVASADQPVPLSGLKDQVRKQREGFSEKTLGYRNFLQFIRAADADGFIALAWDEEAEDYLLRPA